nr:hypothetical protein [Paenisporosarcina indica]
MKHASTANVTQGFNAAMDTNSNEKHAGLDRVEDGVYIYQKL